MIELEQELDSFRTEVRRGFAFVNARLDSVDLRLTKQSDQIKDLQSDVSAIRTEVKQQGADLRSEMKQQGEKLRTELENLLNGAIDSILIGMEGCMETVKAEIRQEIDQKISRITHD